MPSKSRVQQQAAAVALQVKKGKRPKSDLYGASKNMFKMSIEDLEKFAKTKWKGIPKRKRKLKEGWGQKIEIYVDIIYRWLEEKGFNETEIDSILNNSQTYEIIKNAESKGINPIVAIKELDLEEILSSIYHINEEMQSIALNADNLDFYVNKLVNNLSQVTSNHFITVKAKTNLSPSISINFALGGGTGEWANGIIHNDPGFIQLMIHTDPNKGAALDLLTRNYKQKQAGIKPPKQVSGTIDSVTDYVIKYLLMTVPQMEKLLLNESMNEDINGVRPAEKYDLGAGYLGNGLTVWDRSRQENGDYKSVAHISETGKVTIYDSQMPGEILQQIYKWAENGDGRSRSESQGILGESFYPSLKNILSESLNFKNYGNKRNYRKYINRS